MRPGRTGKPGFGGRLLATLVVIILGILPAQAGAPYSAAAVKAAFLFRFPGYIAWPAESLQTRSFVIAVLGADDVAEELRGLQQEREVHDLPVEIRVVQAVGKAQDAHLLFIGAGHAAAARTGVAAEGKRPLLVVTDEESGLTSGSAVNFLTIDRRIRFEISLDAARQAGLEVDSDMLSVATRVLGTR